MDYSKLNYKGTEWTDGRGSPIDAKNLNKIELGITTAIDGVKRNSETINKLISDEMSHYRQLSNSIDNLKSDTDADKQLQEIINHNVDASLETLDKRIDAVYEASLGKIISGNERDINDSCVLVPNDALRTIGITEIGVSAWHQCVGVPNMISTNARVGLISGYGTMHIRDATSQRLYMYVQPNASYSRGGGSITFNPITVGEYLYVQLDVVFSPYGGPPLRDFPTSINCSFTHGGALYSLINTHGNRFLGKIPVPDDLEGEVSTIYLYSNSFMYFNLRVGSKLEVCDHTLTINQLSYNMLDIENDVRLNGMYETDGQTLFVTSGDTTTFGEQTSNITIPKLSTKTHWYKLMFLGDVKIQGQTDGTHRYNDSNQATGVSFSPHTVVDFKALIRGGSYPQPFNMMLVPDAVYPGLEYIPYFKEPLITINFEELDIVDFQIPGNYISFEDMCYHHNNTWDEFSNVVPIEEEIIYIGDKIDTRGLVQVKENAQLYFTNGQDEPIMCNGKYLYLTKI